MRPRLLIAHADDFLTEPFCRYFSRHGFRVEVAHGGVDCVAKLRSFAPDVLVLDWDLLWGGGDGVLALLRDDSNDHAVPIILLTPPAPVEDRSTFGAPPVVACLPKPFHMTDLLRGVQHACAAADGGPVRPAGAWQTA